MLLTPDGDAFLEHAKALLAANRRAVAFEPEAGYRLRIGVSDHAVGGQLPGLLARLHAADPTLALEVHIDFSQRLREAFDRGRVDGIIVREEGGHRDGEALVRDQYGWFAARGFERRAGEPLRIANLAAPCGVRAIAVRALDAARIPWREVFVGGGVPAVAAAAGAGLAAAVFARQVAPAGVVEIGDALGLPRLPRTKGMLHSRVSDARGRSACRVLASVFRGGPPR